MLNFLALEKVDGTVHVGAWVAATEGSQNERGGTYSDTWTSMDISQNL